MNRRRSVIVAVSALVLLAGAAAGVVAAWAHVAEARYRDRALATCEAYAAPSHATYTVTFYSFPPSWRCSWTGGDLVVGGEIEGGGTVLLWWTGK